MFTFYEFIVDRQNDWKIHFLKDGEIKTIKNDKGALERLLSNINFLVGFNNYMYDDKLIASVLKGIDPYEILQKINTNKRVSFRLDSPITIDLKQELGNKRNPILLDEIKLNLGFNSDYNSLQTMKMIFEAREDYFTTKFEVVKEFNLKPSSLKNTQLGIAGDVLNTKKNTDKERLNIHYDNNLQVNELPKTLLDFYKDIQDSFAKGKDFKELEREKFTFKLANIEHVYGFGGLHAAKENYVSDGHFMQIDVKSYYPTIIINNKLMDSTSLNKYKTIYESRETLQKNEDKKEKVYKLITNIAYGGMKSQWSRLYNPQSANSVVVNGQLILTHLILLLENFCELIQTNTDGLIIKYEPVMKDSILKIINLFEQHYSIEFDVDYINKIAQRDVNNYVIRYEDGRLNAVGRFKNYNGGDFERNSLTIIDKALVEYYMNGLKPNRTIINEWKANRLELFQNIVKSGSFDGMAQEVKEDTLFKGTYTSNFKELPRINRVFATNDKYSGAIYKTKDDTETKYTKVPYTSENSIVWNDDLSKLNRRKISLNWYIKEVEKWVF